MFEETGAGRGRFYIEIASVDRKSTDAKTEMIDKYCDWLDEFNITPTNERFFKYGGQIGYEFDVEN